MNKKLKQLFKDLNDVGVVAKRNFSCCQNCGFHEIIDFKKEGTVGYAFYHRQDTPSIKNDNTVYICYSGASYGNTERDDTKNTANIIVHLAEKNGLEVIWNGKITDRILLSNNNGDFK